MKRNSISGKQPYATINLTFPAFFERDELDPSSWNVHVLDSTAVKRVRLRGDDIADARAMASGLVDSWLVTHIKQGTQLPISPESLTTPKLPDAPGVEITSGWELAHPSLQVQFVYALRALRARANLSQEEVAMRMGIKQSVYARLEDPSKANPTLKTVPAASRVFGVELELVAKS